MDNLEKYIINTRRALHQIPELGWDLPETSAYIKKELESMKIPYHTVHKTGIVVTLKSPNPDAKTFIFRADMDGLFVEEKWESDYKSMHSGKMHACGHDGHMAMMLGFLKSLKELDYLPCNVVAIFQPAEEPMEGARELSQIDEMKDADAVFAIHLWTPIPSGRVVLEEGPRMASADRFTINIYGKSSHGGEPQRGVDAIVVACQLVTALQTLISRETDPNDTVILTIGSIQGGTGYNILAGKVTLEGTVRCYHPDMPQKVKRNIQRMMDGILPAFRCTGDLDYYFGTPAVINDPYASALAKTAAIEVLGKDGPMDFPKLGGGEDFAHYMRKVPGCLMLLGARTKDFYPHHHECFNINEAALYKGAMIFRQIVLNEKKSS